MIYAAQFETMNALVGYLTENCCGGSRTCARPRDAASQPGEGRKKPYRDGPTV
jgi:hypothetical protein